MAATMLARTSVVIHGTGRGDFGSSSPNWLRLRCCGGGVAEHPQALANVHGRQDGIARKLVFFVLASFRGWNWSYDWYGAVQGTHRIHSRSFGHLSISIVFFFGVLTKTMRKEEKLVECTSNTKLHHKKL